MYHRILVILFVGSVALAILAASAWKAFRYWRGGRIARGPLIETTHRRDAPHYEVWVGLFVMGIALPVASRFLGMDWSLIGDAFSPRRTSVDSAEVKMPFMPTISVVDSGASPLEGRLSADVSSLNCWSTSPTVYCSFTLMARGDADPYLFHLNSRDVVMFDNRGRRYVAHLIHLGSQGATAFVETYLPPESPIEVQIEFPNVDKFADRVVKVAFTAVRDGEPWNHVFPAAQIVY